MRKLPKSEIETIKEVLDVCGNWLERGYNNMTVANLRAMADYIERKEMGDPSSAEALVLDIVPIPHKNPVTQ